MSTPNENPFGYFRAACERGLRTALKSLQQVIEPARLLLTIPPNLAHGELASSLCFELAKQLDVKPIDLAKQVMEKLPILGDDIIKNADAVNGYINFKAEMVQLSELTLNGIHNRPNEYGTVRTPKPRKIIVEHTSANPSGPLHAGTARNAILGDAISRLLLNRGHTVRRHFYIDDVGKQVAMVAYAYKLLDEPKSGDKPDSRIGLLYTTINCIIALQTLKDKLKIHGAKDAETASKIQREIDDYMGILGELKQSHGEILDKILTNLANEPEPEKVVESLIKDYENEVPATKQLIRKVVEQCLEGFKQTLQGVGIAFDQWDWESELVWNGDVKRAVESLQKTPFLTIHDKALALDVDAAARTLGVKQQLFPGLSAEIPPLILVRTDGTTLYTTRDIAYHLRKFAWADQVVNVIGVDQKLAQLQLKVALAVMGVTQALDGLIHYSYELVALPGVKMSRRRGRYVSFDDISGQAVSMAYNEVVKRAPDLEEQEKRLIAHIVGVGAVKFAMLNLSANKTVVFSWDRVLNFEVNSAPFIQYAHARACSILRRADFKWEMPSGQFVKHELERRLILRLSRFPEVVIEATDTLQPEMITAYANDLAAEFNSFYNELPVLKAEFDGSKKVRLAMVDSVRQVLHNSLNLLGIVAPARM